MPNMKPRKSIPLPTGMIAHVKTSAAAAKGFSLYAGRHGEKAARQMSYGFLSTVGFYAAAAELDTVNAGYWGTVVNELISRGY